MQFTARAKMLPIWAQALVTASAMIFIAVSLLQKRAPSAHTVLEIVHARWGTGARFSFLWFLMVTAIIVSGQLILGGSAVISALTGECM